MAVQLFGVVEQLESRREDGGSDLESVVHAVEFLSPSLAVSLDLEEPGSDLVAGRRPLSCQVEQVLFLAFELGKLGRQVLLEQRGGVLAVAQCVVEDRSDSFAELPGEAQRAVVPCHGILDRVVIDGWSVAKMLVSAPAAEGVEVFAAVADGAMDDEASLSAMFVAARTPDAAHQIVTVLSLTLPALGLLSRTY